MKTSTSIPSPASVHLDLDQSPTTKLESPSDMHLDEVHAQVRPFQDTDLQQVQDLFLKAMVTGSESTCKRHVVTAMLNLKLFSRFTHANSIGRPIN